MPVSTKGLVYNDPAVRASWALHGTDAFYVGPTPNYYRCLQFYMPTTLWTHGIFIQAIA
jgi:hypothetical protein